MRSVDLLLLLYSITIQIASRLEITYENGSPQPSLHSSYSLNKKFGNESSLIDKLGEPFQKVSSESFYDGFVDIPASFDNNSDPTHGSRNTRSTEQQKQDFWEKKKKEALDALELARKSLEDAKIQLKTAADDAKTRSDLYLKTLEKFATCVGNITTAKVDLNRTKTEREAAENATEIWLTLEEKKNETKTILDKQQSIYSIALANYQKALSLSKEANATYAASKMKLAEIEKYLKDNADVKKKNETFVKFNASIGAEIAKATEDLTKELSKEEEILLRLIGKKECSLSCYLFFNNQNGTGWTNDLLIADALKKWEELASKNPPQPATKDHPSTKLAKLVLPEMRKMMEGVEKGTYWRNRTVEAAKFIVNSWADSSVNLTNKIKEITDLKYSNPQYIKAKKEYENVKKKFPEYTKHENILAPAQRSMVADEKNAIHLAAPYASATKILERENRTLMEAKGNYSEAKSACDSQESVLKPQFEARNRLEKAYNQSQENLEKLKDTLENLEKLLESARANSAQANNTVHFQEDKVNGAENNIKEKEAEKENAVKEFEKAVEARKEAEEKARKEAEEKARKEAKEKSRKEAEEKARKEAEEKARKEAEEKQSTMTKLGIGIGAGIFVLILIAVGVVVGVILCRKRKGNEGKGNAGGEPIVMKKETRKQEYGKVEVKGKDG